MTDWESSSPADVMTPAEAAEFYKCSVKTVIRAAENRQVLAAKVGKRWRFFTSASRVITLPADTEDGS